MPLLVTPLSNSFNLRLALLIMFPGCYVLSALGFTITMLVYMSRNKNKTLNKFTMAADRPEAAVDDVKRPLNAIPAVTAECGRIDLGAKGDGPAEK